jgi:hypothetical protein
MLHSRLLLPAALAVALVGAIAPAMADAPLVIPLAAQNGSGEKGTATFIPRGDKTEVIVSLMGAPKGVAQPNHIHMGTCAKLNPAPTYPLKITDNGVSDTTVDVPLSKLLASPFAVNVHESAKALGHYVACGDITEPSQ